MSSSSSPFSSESIVLVLLSHGDEILRVNGRTLFKFTFGVDRGNSEFVAQNLAIALHSILCVVELEISDSKKGSLPNVIDSTQRLMARPVSMRAWSLSSEALKFSHFLVATDLSSAYASLMALEPAVSKRRPSDLLAMDCTLSPSMASDLIRAEFSKGGHSRQALADGLALLKQFSASQFEDENAMARYLLSED